jgi:hypothetical protein
MQLKDCPGKSYTKTMKEALNNYFKSGDNPNEMIEVRNSFLSELSDLTSFSSEIKIDAPIEVIATTSLNAEYIYLFLTNVRAICTLYDSEIRSVKNVKISFGNSVGSAEVYMLPFLGIKENIKTQMTGNEISFTIPEIEKGMVIMIRRN